MDNREFVIGIVGGMGSYATLSFFERLLKAFPAEKEWDRPRIIIDNRCTMPSRVRAVLYNEKFDEVKNSIKDSIENLMKMGGEDTNIILVCNTSHIFLYEMAEEISKYEKNVINIIEACAKELQSKGINEVFVIATEGTIESKIYHKVFQTYNIKVKTPSEKEYSDMRYYIEIVKQGKVDKDNIKAFENYLLNFNEENLVLGCTEFSTLYRYIENGLNGVNIIDPLESAIEELKRRWDSYAK